jgi:hypothetical protein
MISLEGTMLKQNFLSPIEFQFSIERLPNLQFFIQSVNIPDITSGMTERSSPFKKIYGPGDKLEYGELIISCLIDEQMETYKEVWNWLIATTYPNGFEQYRELQESGNGIFSDATLLIMNSSKNPNIEIKFTDVFPTSVGPIQLDTTDTDVTPPQVDFSFKFSHYEFV